MTEAAIVYTFYYMNNEPLVNDLYTKIKHCKTEEEYVYIEKAIYDIPLNQLEYDLFNIMTNKNNNTIFDLVIYENKMDIFFMILNRLQESPNMKKHIIKQKNAFELYYFVIKLINTTTPNQFTHIKYFMEHYPIDFTTLYGGLPVIYNLFGYFHNYMLNSKSYLSTDETKEIMIYLISNPDYDYTMIWGYDNAVNSLFNSPIPLKVIINQHFNKFAEIDKHLIKHKKLSFITQLFKGSENFYVDCVTKFTNKIDLNFSKHINKFIETYVLFDLNSKLNNMQFTHDQLTLIHKNDLQAIIYLHIFIAHNSDIPKDILMIISYNIILLHFNDYQKCYKYI